MSHALVILPAAAKDIEALAPELRDRVQPRIDALAADPRPQGSRKLRGERDRYRIRVGDYRVLYDVDDEQRIVRVVCVGHRSDVYQ